MRDAILNVPTEPRVGAGTKVPCLIIITRGKIRKNCVISLLTRVSQVLKMFRNQVFVSIPCIGNKTELLIVATHWRRPPSYRGSPPRAFNPSAV